MSIETFALVKEPCLLAHINTREETHGKESKKGYDLKFVADMHNSVLLKFHPELRNAFYKADDTRDMHNPDNMPHLRLPMIKEVGYDLEIPRIVLRIHDVDDPANDFLLGGGKANKFRFTMKNGGTVELTFRVQFSNPNEEEMFKAYRVEFQKVQISLECKEEEKKADNFEQVEQAGKEPMSEAREKAESLFDTPRSDMALKPDDVVNAAPVEVEDKKPATPSNVKPIGTKTPRAKRQANGAAPE